MCVASTAIALMGALIALDIVFLSIWVAFVNYHEKRN